MVIEKEKEVHKNGKIMTNQEIKCTSLLLKSPKLDNLIFVRSLFCFQTRPCRESAPSLRHVQKGMGAEQFPYDPTGQGLHALAHTTGWSFHVKNIPATSELCVIAHPSLYLLKSALTSSLTSSLNVTGLNPFPCSR